MDLLDLGKYAAAVVAVSGAAAVLWRLFSKAVRSVVEGAIEQVRKAQMEADEDFASAVGTLHTRLDAIEDCLKDVRAQVYPNSGSSLRDRVDDLYELVLQS